MRHDRIGIVGTNIAESVALLRSVIREIPKSEVVYCG